MTSPFSLVAPHLRTNGYSVIPIMPHSKRPAIEKWSDFGIKAADDETFARWLVWKDMNIGVTLGVASNLVGMDLDNDVDNLHSKIVALLPPTQVIKVGAKGCTMFYQYNGQKTQSFSKNGVRVLDVLSQGRQTVLPPSIHPDIFCDGCNAIYEIAKYPACPHCFAPRNGAEKHPVYQWQGKGMLDNTPASALPHISLQTIHDISKLFDVEETKHHVVQPRQIMVYDDTKKEEVAQALSYISADDYDQWYKIGMCLKDKFGNQGFELWDTWSQSSTKYNNKEMRSKWNSFHGSGLTIASLFYLAMDNGFSNISSEWLDPVYESQMIDGRMTGANSVAAAPAPKPQFVAPAEVIQQEEPEKKIDSINFPLELLDAPGLPGKIAQLINRTSLMPQPVLALGAAIAAAGSLMGRKVRGDTNLRTNFYVIGLAPSGSGKDHARTVIKRILHDTGLGDTELGVPASSAGLIGSLRDRGKGRGIILWDEFGRTLKNLASFRAGTHERDITTSMIELFSSSQSIYMGKAYANHDGKSPMKPIDQPCLSVYATSVPGHFYEALSGGEAIDGFLGRWLIFESKDYTMEEETNEQVFAGIPQDMIDICKFWKEQPFNSSPNQGNIADVMTVVPRLIECTPAAAAHLKGFATEMRKKARTCELAGEAAGSIWSRAGEHARRLALVAHEDDKVDLNAAEWGVKMAQFSCEYMATAISDYVSSTELESQTKRMLRSIKEKTKTMDTWVTRADITRSFQGLPSRTRMEIIGSLVERGDITEEKAQNKMGRPSFRYRAI